MRHVTGRHRLTLLEGKNSKSQFLYSNISAIDSAQMLTGLVLWKYKTQGEFKQEVFLKKIANAYLQYQVIFKIAVLCL